MKHSLLILSMVLLGACGDGKKDVADGQALADENAQGLIVDLGRYDMPLIVDLGDPATLGVDTPMVKWDEEFGRMEVSGGEHFELTISEEPADMARLKADLERSMLQQNTVLEETPEKIVYKSQFPDDDLVFIHFQQVVTVGERTFIVRDADQGRFNEADVARMSNAVSSKTPA